MTLRIQKDVLRLQVPVNEAFLMKIVKSKNQFTCIEPSFFLIESLFFSQMKLQITTVDIVKCEEEPVWRLKSIMHFYDEGVLNFQKNLTFKSCVMYLPLLVEIFLFQHF